MAGLDPTDRAGAALVVGITTAGMFETEEAYRRWRAGVDPHLRLSRWLGMPLSTVGVVVAQTLGIFGPRATVSTACSSGALAIATAAGMVARGEAPVAVALGVDTLELDTAITRDGVLVIHHDLTLNPNTTRDASGRWLEKRGPQIHTLTWAELLTYDVGRLKPGSDYGRNYPDQHQYQYYISFY